jgi:thiosulfate reductase cytochrome b subunit
MELSGNTVDGRRRILTGLALLTGLNCLAAAGSVVSGGYSTAVAVLFGVLGVALFVFAAVVLRGYADGLTDDDQLFWQLAE